MLSAIWKKCTSLPRNVVLLGLISGLNDISSEMLYPILPVFLTQVLGVSVLMVGIIEGLAEATASIFKVIFGYWSDSIQKRKPFIITGYTASAVGKVIIAFAHSWPLVYFGKIIDRIGKGARTGARDALLLEAADVKNRGFVFGFHRSMDSLGAVAGPIIVLILLSFYHNALRLILYVATIPTILALLFFFLVKESKRNITVSKVKLNIDIKHLSPQLQMFLIGFAIFSLGNSSDTFLILKAKSLGLNIFLVISAYVVYNVIYTIASTPAGIIADKIGAKKVFLLGIVIYTLVYLGFAYNTNHEFVWILFAVYGLYIALTDGISRAITGELIVKEHAGAAYGILYTVTSIFGLLASVIGGILWSLVSPSATFLFAAICSIISFVFLIKFFFTHTNSPVLSSVSNQPTVHVQPSSSLKKIFIIGSSIVIFVASFAILFIVQKQFPPKITTVQVTNNTKKHERFANSKYVPYAYQIFPGPISRDALQALSYFELQKKSLSGNIVQIKIRPVGPYYWKTFLIKPGYKFYFATLPDAEGDINDAYDLDYLSYDVPILVDNKGFIVNL